MSEKLDDSNLDAILEELQRRAINHLHEILEAIQESEENENRSSIGGPLVRYLESSYPANCRYIEGQMRTDFTLIELLKFEVLDVQADFISLNYLAPPLQPWMIG